MSRVLVTAVFGAAFVGVCLTAVERFDALFANPDTRHFAVAGYWALKTAIVGAFCLFVALRDPAREPSRNPVAFLACATAMGAIVLLREPSQDAGTTAVLVGDFVALVACAWLLASVLTLGRCFGVLPEVRGLVTRGPYRLVRHPVYLGEFGTAVGLVIGAPSLWNFGAVFAFVLAQVTRMRLEEQALRKEFAEYAEYESRTPRLLPRVPRPRRVTAPPPAAKRVWGV